LLNYPGSSGGRLDRVGPERQREEVSASQRAERPARRRVSVDGLAHVVGDGATGERVLYVGSPETVAAKITATAETLGLSRFDLKYSAGTFVHGQMLHSMSCNAREVAPAFA
jgi:alkanesulfonate monooxygenase SsuD/methylene tetrahydromethanopterin reductase-like flavin-dependent oxidoreductase (luciferase family)